ncbi:hypothetical protein SBY92_003536 [Candida maltosa Xu316]
MSDLENYTKAELGNLLKKLRISFASKTTKKALISKIEQFVTENPDQYDFVQAFLKDEEEEQDDEQEDDDDEEGDEDDDEEEGDDDEDEEEEGEEIDEEEDDEENDKDYEAPPPLNLKEWVVDPIIAKSENIIDKFYQFTDNVGITYLHESEKLRDQLSSTVTLNYATILVEFLIFIYNFVKVVPLNENNLVHQIFHDNLPFVSSSEFPTLEITGLFDYKSIVTFSIWLSTSVLIPLVISYFVNFTSRVIEIEDDEYLFRVYSFDPFIFSLSKVLTYYFIGQSILIEFATKECIISSLFNKALINLGLYHTFAASLGNLPYILGGVNVLIALYAQFEEY